MHIEPTRPTRGSTSLRGLLDNSDGHRVGFCMEVGMAEEWRAVVGYEGLYEVSDHGRVRSLRIRTSWVNRLREKPLTLRPMIHGTNGRIPYWMVALSDNGRQFLSVHRLVLGAFVGLCPEGHQGAHLNGISLDNRATNLKWVTQTENQRMRVAHGTANIGDQNPRAKLTWDQVDTIRARVTAGESQEGVAKDFPVGARTINKIVLGKRWKQRGGRE